MTAKEARVTVQIRKAVFPAAGLGSRFLPATRAQPKEMLPLVDKPIIQYGVEEALASGADQIIVVAGKYQHVIEAHFTPNKPLEDFLESQGKIDLLAEVRAVPCPATFTSVLEATPQGLGHAVLAAREAFDSEHRTLEIVVHINELARRGRLRVNHVIAQNDDKWFVADRLPCR